jgi:hypothetical protein
MKYDYIFYLYRSIGRVGEEKRVRKPIQQRDHGSIWICVVSVFDGFWTHFQLRASGIDGIDAPGMEA